MGANEVEQILVRIYLGESRSVGGQPLHRQLLELLCGEGMPGAVVVKGCTGHGHDRVVHTTLLECQMVDLPVVIETVDSPEHVDRLLAKVDAPMSDGLVMTERLAWSGLDRRVITVRGRARHGHRGDVLAVMRIPRWLSGTKAGNPL